MNVKNYGFTLIELIISIAIIAILGGVISQVFFQTTRSNAKSEILKEVKQNGDYALNVMQRMIRNSTEITSSCSDAGVSGTSLTITNPDLGTTTFQCLSSGSIQRIASVSGGRIDYLTDSNVTLGGITCNTSTFETVCTSVRGIPNNVNISFTLSQIGTSAVITNPVSENFNAFVTLRNILQY